MMNIPTTLKKLSVLLFVALLSTVQMNLANAEERSRVIDFEDEIIEGMNKRPLDYLAQISERDGRKKKLHLYQKRAGFRTETRELLRETRMFQ